jgi:peroxiredoxin
MNNMLKFLVIFLTLTTGAFAYADVKTGDPAPNFSLTDTNGQSHSLTDLKGKYVVLEWYNPDCPFVKKHYDSGNMQALQKEFADKGVVWLMVSSSSTGKEGNYSSEEFNKILKDQKANDTALLLDSNGEVGKLYGAKTTPHMFVINSEGVLIYQGAIDDKPSTDTADIATSKNYVRDALNEAMRGTEVAMSTTKSYGCSVKY